MINSTESTATVLGDVVEFGSDLLLAQRFANIW